MFTKAKKPTLRDVLRADLRAMGTHRTDILYMGYCCLMRPDFLAVLLYRLSSIFKDKGFLGKAMSQIFWRLNIFINACEIDPAAKIGEGFALAHTMGIVIGPVIMGRNVEIFQNVSIGRRDRSDHYNGPDSRAQIGDNVIIYSGAVVVGGIKIGDGASIGANAVVLKDVPENCLAVGIPARIIEKSPAWIAEESKARVA